jgi:ABC-type Fe3+ transport system permease subunit
MGMLVARLNKAWADVLAIVPLGVPALIVALAYSRFYNRTWPIDLAAVGDTSLLVVLGLTARSWPFVTRLIADGQRRVSPEWREAAQLAGMTTTQRGRWIIGPLLADHALAGALVAYILVAGDVEISQMLCAPGSGTLALRLFTFLHFGPVHVAASLALVELALTVLPVLAYFLFTQRLLKVV